MKINPTKAMGIAIRTICSIYFMLFPPKLKSIMLNFRSIQQHEETQLDALKLYSFCSKVLARCYSAS